MPLNPATLVDGLSRWLDPPSPTTVQSAHKFAEAYKAYAATATVGAFPVNPAQLETAAGALESTLSGVFSAGDPASFCLGVASALSLFWVTLGAGGFAGPVTGGIAIPATLQPILLSVLVAGMAGAPSITIANLMATQLDIWTRTVLYTVPPGAQVPLT